MIPYGQTWQLIWTRHPKKDGITGQEGAHQQVATLDCSGSLVDPTVKAMVIIIYVCICIVLNIILGDKE